MYTTYLTFVSAKFKLRFMNYPIYYGNYGTLTTIIAIVLLYYYFVV